MIYKWQDPPPVEQLWDAAGFGIKSSYFLDSVRVSSTARWCYISLSEPHTIFKSFGNRIIIEKNGKRREFTSTAPLLELKKLVLNSGEHHNSSELPFAGGAVGYFSYDFGRHFEKIISSANFDRVIPESCFIFCSDFVAYDIKNKAAYIVSKTPRYYLKKLKTLNKPPQIQNSASNFYSNFTKKEFKGIVKKAKEYISIGDSYQVNLAQRFSAQFSGDKVELFRQLRKINPSPYSLFFQTPEVSLVSCSPELLLKKHGEVLETRPIAGTKPRSGNDKSDQKISGSLLLDPKERAEHIMLVDLERNDLGRVCRPKTIRVSENMVIEKYSHVIHIVSNVVGKLKKGEDFFTAFKALFPGGTITGCPKVRSMEIIEELEGLRRGPYCGSAGWIGFNGDGQLNILIRTIILTPDKKQGSYNADFYAGAGIVADSKPEKEYFETIHKAKALAQALNIKKVLASKGGRSAEIISKW